VATVRDLGLPADGVRETVKGGAVAESGGVERGAGERAVDRIDGLTRGVVPHLHLVSEAVGAVAIGAVQFEDVEQSSEAPRAGALGARVPRRERVGRDTDALPSEQPAELDLARDAEGFTTPLDESAESTSHGDLRSNSAFDTATLDHLQLHVGGDVLDERMKIASTGHSRHLRNVLRAARADLGLSAQQVADRIARAMGKEKFSGQSVLYYEAFQRHPPIDVFAFWARSVGYRLVVELDKLGNERQPVLLRHEEVAEIARALDEASPEVRAAVATIVRQMIK
jgi:hypothetical protein